MAESLVAMNSALSTRTAVSHAVRPAASASRSKAVCSLAKKLPSQGKTLAGSSLKAIAPKRLISQSRKTTQVPTSKLATAVEEEPLSEQMTAGGWEVHKCVYNRLTRPIYPVQIATALR